MNYLSLEETLSVLLIWTKSCNNAPSLDFMIDVIDRFVKQRFEGNAPDWQLQNALTDLKEAWIDQKYILVKNSIPEVFEEVPTLAFQDMDN